jgi:hypothetical protein
MAVFGPTQNRLSKTLRFAWVGADALFPFGVWSGYAKNRLTVFGMIRFVPAAMLLFPLTFFLILFLPVEPSVATPHPSMESLSTTVIDPDSFFMRLNSGSNVIWVSKRHSILRMELDDEGTGEAALVPAGPAEGKGAYSFGLSSSEKQLLVSGHQDNDIRLLLLDASTMDVLWDKAFAMPGGEVLKRSIMLWDSDRELALAVYDAGSLERHGGGIVKFSPDLNSIVRFGMCGNLQDAILVPDRRRILVLSYRPGMILEVDADSLEILRYALLPDFANQIAADWKRRRLFISFPIEGVIRILDLNTFDVAHTVPSVIGVRSLLVLEQKNALITAGYSPYAQVYRLSDLHRINRVVLRNWIRNSAYNPVTEQVYFSSMWGLFKIPIQDLLEEKEPSIWNKVAPFFWASQFLVSTVHSSLTRQSAQGTIQDVQDCRQTLVFPQPGLIPKTVK